MDDSKVDLIKKWLYANGGRLQENVRIAYDQLHGYYLQAQDNFESNQAVVHVPRSVTLSLHTIEFASSQWPSDFLSRYAQQPYIISRFLLMDEYLHGQKSWWVPYISLLPQPWDDVNSPPFDTPLWFSEEDLQGLRGTSLYAATQQRQHSWFDEYTIAEKHLMGLVNHSRFSWLLYKWAATIFSSRCFPSTVPFQHRTPPQDPSERERPLSKPSQEASVPVLVPVLDLANHDPNVRVQWIINEDGYTFNTDTQYSSGQQIFNNYGAKGNEELLMGYGFTIENNPADSLGIKYRLTDSLQTRCVRAMLRTGRSLALDINPAQITFQAQQEPEFDAPPDVFYLYRGTVVSTGLLDTIRLSIANEREMRMMHQGSDARFSRLSAQANAQLMLALTQRYNTVYNSKTLGSQKPTTRVRTMVLAYTIGQLQILNDHIISLNQTNSALRESDAIWTLDAVLNDTPALLRLAMRGFCRTTLGTRNVVKLKAKNMEDPLMTIFVCLVWVVFNSDDWSDPPQSVDGNATDGVDTFRTWVGFLRSSYCSPPGFEGVCRGVNCHCTTSNIQPWSFEINQVEDGRSAHVAYTMIQRAFMLNLLNPTFGKIELWSKDFLIWGYGVWQSEAVTSPILDGDQDLTARFDHEISAEQEFALFLEFES